METPQQQQPPLNFCTVLSESKRIINAHSRHFLALSVLFLLPLSFSLVVYPTIQQQLTQPNTQLNTKTLLSFSPLLNQQQQQPLVSNKTPIILSVIYTFFLFTFSPFSVGSITYSVYHGFYGRPVKLISAIKSTFTSFLPLLATSLATQVIIYGIFVVCGLVCFLVFKGIEFMGFDIDYSSPYFTRLSVVFLVVLVLVLIYLQVNWTLVCVVVVVEKRWGFESLKRAAGLIKGMRRVALSSLLVFGFFVMLLVWSSSISGLKIGVGGGGADVGWWKSWGFVVQIVVTSTLIVLLMLYNFAVNVVLYMYCKAIHGELAMEIAEEFAREYVSLPFDDGKVPHVVSVVYP